MLLSPCVIFQYVPWPTTDIAFSVYSLFALRLSAPQDTTIRSDYTLNFYGLSFTASVSVVDLMKFSKTPVSIHCLSLKNTE
jgi:hypothetical protein